MMPGIYILLSELTHFVICQPTSMNIKVISHMHSKEQRYSNLCFFSTFLFESPAYPSQTVPFLFKTIWICSSCIYLFVFFFLRTRLVDGNRREESVANGKMKDPLFFDWSFQWERLGSDIFIGINFPCFMEKKNPCEIWVFEFPMGRKLGFFFQKYP